MAKRDIPEINAGSMADIAFLLLIFFLVTTTMDNQTGILRLLPPLDVEEQKDEVEVKERNVFVVVVNLNNDILAEGKPIQVEELRPKVKEFILNENKSVDLPVVKWIDNDSILKVVESFRADWEQETDPKQKANKLKKLQKGELHLKAVDWFGDVYQGKKGYWRTNHVISVQNDHGTNYETYITVNNELTRAYNELKDELARKRLGKGLQQLEKEKKKDELKALSDFIFPKKISEAEPLDVGS